MYLLFSIGGCVTTLMSWKQRNRKINGVDKLEDKKFDKFTRQDGGLYVCRICGKKTRETGNDESGVQLCANCYDRCTLENDHNDYGHAQKEENCPVCEKEAEQ